MYTDILPDNMPRTQGTEHRICSHIYIYIYIYIYGMVWTWSRRHSLGALKINVKLHLVGGLAAPVLGGLGGLVCAEWAWLAGGQNRAVGKTN